MGRWMSRLGRSKPGRLAIAVVIGVALPGTAAAADGFHPRGDGPSLVDLGIGGFDLIGSRSRNAVAGRVELRFGEKLIWKLGPAIGLVVNDDEGYYGNGAVYMDIAYDDWVITPLAGAGGYRRGEGRDLGGTFQFRLSLTAARAFAGGMRLGLNFAHISNAGIQKTNPGEEEFYLTLGIPIDLF